jgi:hypothetical protein
MFIYAQYLLYYLLYCIIIVHVGQLYMHTYLFIGQYICCVLDTSHIIYLYLILLQIFSKCHANFFNIFLSIFHFYPTFPRLWLKPTGKLVKPPG